MSLWTEKQFILTNKNNYIMPFIKDSDSDREDYLLQDDKTTIFTGTFVIVALIVLVIAVIVSGFYFEWF